MLRMYIIAAVVVAVGGALLGARAYYKDTQERIATLHKNNAKMEVVQKQNEAVMKSLTEETTRLNELNFDLHDLTRLSHQKPGMIEKRINNGTQKVFDSLESLTTTTSK